MSLRPCMHRWLSYAMTTIITGATTEIIRSVSGIHTDSVLKSSTAYYNTNNFYQVKSQKNIVFIILSFTLYVNYLNYKVLFL